MRKITELPDLRKAVKAWVQAFADEGPYEEDVEALGKYLREVVGMERDMGKAVAVVKWMVWVVEEMSAEEGLSADVREAWDEALRKVKDSVQEAVADRGLREVEFE